MFEKFVNFSRSFGDEKLTKSHMLKCVLFSRN
jgi:hypothetical protein